MLISVLAADFAMAAPLTGLSGLQHDRPMNILAPNFTRTTTTASGGS